VGEALVGGARLPRADHPLAVGGADVDHPFGVDAAPPRRVGAGRRNRRRLDRGRCRLGGLRVRRRAAAGSEVTGAGWVRLRSAARRPGARRCGAAAGRRGADRPREVRVGRPGSRPARPHPKCAASCSVEPEPELETASVCWSACSAAGAGAVAGALVSGSGATAAGAVRRTLEPLPRRVRAPSRRAPRSSERWSRTPLRRG
jgi:hypothetical protein